MRTFILTLSSLVLLAAASRADQPDCTALPQLRHSPSFLGNTMTLSVTRAPADTAVLLFYSPLAERSFTSVGFLELERTQLVLVAFGTTNPEGEWTFDVEIPADESFAETEAHYQALVMGTAFPGGATLSTATHMRLAGPRVYVTWSGRDSPEPENAGLAIVSVLNQEVLHEVNLGPADSDVLAMGDGRPVFCPVCELGVLVADSEELTVFDPHFGVLRGTVPIEHPSRSVFMHPEGLLAFALETGYRTPPLLDSNAKLQRVSLCDPGVDETLELPYFSPGLWTTNDAGTEAYVGEINLSGRTAVRRVDLIGFQDLGAVEVGLAGSFEFTAMKWAFGRLYVATLSPSTLQEKAELTSVDWSGSSTLVDVSTNWQRIPVIVASPEVGVLTMFNFDMFVPSGGMRVVRPGNIHLQGGLGLPWVYLHCNAIVAQDNGLWVLDSSNNEPPSATDPGRLYHVGLDGSGWTQHPSLYHMNGPVTMDLLRDAYVDVIALATFGHNPPVDIQPELILIDKATEPTGEMSIPLGFQPTMLHAVRVP